ncbi:MAG TPA: VOC family protein [Acidobacteriota bacterium]|nr:VOC family protein [Acidobacteriota bacterium]
MKDWKITTTIPTFAVPELQAGIDFYTRLGFETDWSWPDDNPTHAGLYRGECSIMLCKSEPCERADVYFIVDDVSACHAQVMKGRCWEMVSEAAALANREDCPPKQALHPPAEPGDTDYGLRDFSVVDPWGHHMTFGEVMR